MLRARQDVRKKICASLKQGSRSMCVFYFDLILAIKPLCGTRDVGYTARRARVHGRACHGVGGEFVPRISSREKAVLRMWRETFDQAVKGVVFFKKNEKRELEGTNLSSVWRRLRVSRGVTSKWP